ncbi:MAG: P-loop NTPase family protein [Saccharospirillum sp.]
MDQNKLYNALLKTQALQQKDKPQDTTDTAETDPTANPYRIEKPYARSPRMGLPHSAEDEQPPTVYDPSVSLKMIHNPHPWSKDELKKRKIIYSGMGNKGILNAYREVRIKLRNRSEDKNFSVMVSSLSKRDSSVLNAFNLAASFALDPHSSALMVDCNPYTEELHKLVSVKMDRGITDFVADPEMAVTDIIYPSGIDRLSVVPAGHLSSSAVELFSSARMRTLMDELKGRYPDRYIVINSPSLRESTEGHILVRYADHAVLTVPFGEVTADQVVDAVDEIDPDKFAGLIYQE